MNYLEFSEALENPGKEYNFAENLKVSFEKNCFALNTPVGDAQVSFKYFADYDARLHLKGFVKMPFEFMCDRCGSMFSKNLFIEIDECISPKVEGDSLITYDLPRIDLDDVVKSFIITSFPSKVLCREDCKGLCPHCGANLNDGDCGCNKSN